MVVMTGRRTPKIILFSLNSSTMTRLIFQWCEKDTRIVFIWMVHLFIIYSIPPICLKTVYVAEPNWNQAFTMLDFKKTIRNILFLGYRLWNWCYDACCKHHVCLLMHFSLSVDQLYSYTRRSMSVNNGFTETSFSNAFKVLCCALLFSISSSFFKPVS